MSKIKKIQIAKNLAYVLFALENVQTQMPVELLDKCQDSLIDVADLMGIKMLNTTYNCLKELRERT